MNGQREFTNNSPPVSRDVGRDFMTFRKSACEPFTFCRFCVFHLTVATKKKKIIIIIWPETRTSGIDRHNDKVSGRTPRRGVYRWARFPFVLPTKRAVTIRFARICTRRKVSFILSSPGPLKPDFCANRTNKIDDRDRQYPPCRTEAGNHRSSPGPTERLRYRFALISVCSYIKYTFVARTRSNRERSN